MTIDHRDTTIMIAIIIAIIIVVIIVAIVVMIIIMVIVIHVAILTVVPQHQMHISQVFLPSPSIPNELSNPPIYLFPYHSIGNQIEKGCEGPEEDRITDDSSEEEKTGGEEVETTHNAEQGSPFMEI